MRCVYAWYSFMHDMGGAIVDCAILKGQCVGIEAMQSHMISLPVKSLM